jgi:hypothetical protein
MKAMSVKEKEVYNNSFINTDISEYYIDNNRKITVTESYHNNKCFISIRTWIKTTIAQGNKWLPSRKGLYIPMDVIGTFWTELSKDIENLIDKNVQKSA